MAEDNGIIDQTALGGTDQYTRNDEWVLRPFQAAGLWHDNHCPQEGIQWRVLEDEDGASSGLLRAAHGIKQGHPYVAANHA